MRGGGRLLGSAQPSISVPKPSISVPRPAGGASGPSSGGARVTANIQSLPKWAQSVLGAFNTSKPPCTQKWLEHLPENMQGEAAVMRVDRFLCAKAVAEEGRFHYHNSNGTMVAVYNDRLYLACIHKKDKITRQMGGVQLVNKHSKKKEEGGYTFEFDGRCITWVGLGEKMFKALGCGAKKDVSFPLFRFILVGLLDIVG